VSLDPRVRAEPLVRGLAEPVEQHQQRQTLLGLRVLRQHQGEPTTALGQVEDAKISEVLIEILGLAAALTGEERSGHEDRCARRRRSPRSPQNKLAGRGKKVHSWPPAAVVRTAVRWRPLEGDTLHASWHRFRWTRASRRLWVRHPRRVWKL